MNQRRLGKCHVPILVSAREMARLGSALWTEEDLEHLNDAIFTICKDTTAVAVPGLAHVRNKLAARLGKRYLITTGEEEDRPWEEEE